MYGLVVFFLLLLLLHFSYAYYLALAVATLTLIALSILYTQQHSKDNLKKAGFLYQFELSQQGLCSFDGSAYYQLQTSSRFSFLGCWLSLKPMAKSKVLPSKKKQLFIYRDSLSKQDFSRLAQVLKNLANTKEN